MISSSDLKSFMKEGCPVCNFQAEGDSYEEFMDIMVVFDQEKKGSIPIPNPNEFSSSDFHTLMNHDSSDNTTTPD